MIDPEIETVQFLEALANQILGAETLVNAYFLLRDLLFGDNSNEDVADKYGYFIKDFLRNLCDSLKNQISILHGIENAQEDYREHRAAIRRDMEMAALIADLENKDKEFDAVCGDWEEFLPQKKQESAAESAAEVQIKQEPVEEEEPAAEVQIKQEPIEEEEEEEAAEVVRHEVVKKPVRERVIKKEAETPKCRLHTETEKYCKAISLAMQNKHPGDAHTNYVVVGTYRKLRRPLVHTLRNRVIVVFPL